MKKIMLSLCLVLALGAFASATHAEIKIGMLAQRGPDTALKEWGGIADYLTGKLNEKVVIVPLSFTDFMDFCHNNPNAFIFTNPWFYTKAKVVKGGKALVTVRYQGSGDKFGSVIFTRNDSGINSIQELRGKVLMCPKLSSPGGWLFAKGEIVRNGIVPEKDLKQILETEKESHDEVVYSVRDKKADVGTVRTNILETMQRERKINIADFRVLNPMKHEGFQELCSTPLYPDWPVASLRDTPTEVAMRMKQALLNIPTGDPALQQARRIEKFVEALDYGPMEDLCKFLQAPPFRRRTGD